MQHLQYGNYDIRYMVYVRKMADTKQSYVKILNKSTVCRGLIWLTFLHIEFTSIKFCTLSKINITQTIP